MPVDNPGIWAKMQQIEWMNVIKVNNASGLEALNQW